MKLTDIFFGLNALTAVFGWLVFTFARLTFTKDEEGEKFSTETYAENNWNRWVGSLLIVPILLAYGVTAKIPSLDLDHFDWWSLYYVGSGLAFELIVAAIPFIGKLVKGFFKKLPTDENNGTA